MAQSQNFENIALTGLMGSGKSSVGRTLARILKRQFIDTDTFIEQKTGKSINEIFESKGEKYFRDLEKETIDEIFKKRGQIVSLGGGTIVDNKNRAIVKSHAKLVALIASPQELYERVKRRKLRPLLNQAEDQLSTLEKLWDERKSAYLDSHLQIETSNKEIDSIAYEIIEKLHLKRNPFHRLTVDIKRENAKYLIRFQGLEKLNFSDLDIGKQILIVSQEPVAKHYMDVVKKHLKKDFKVETMIVQDGEQAKNYFTYQLIVQKLLDLKFERKDTVIALGGGVVGDLAGFAASTYYRGIHYIQIPTSLLAMIDSSVGGKTGVNVPEGKNLIGTFYQPHLVYIDIENLQTLSDREFKCGLGELVKYTLLGADLDSVLGESFFSFVLRNVHKILNKDPGILIDIIEHCLKIKTMIITQDEREQGLRMHLNLGHTFGHAIEELTQYIRYSHGETVAMGIVCACYLSEEINCFKNTNTQKVLELMDKLGLNYKIPKDLQTKDIIEALKHDKKIERGKCKFIAPKHKIGRVDVFYDLNLAIIRRAIDRNR